MVSCKSLLIIFAVVFLGVFILPSHGQNIVIPPGQIPATSMPSYSMLLTIQSENIDITVNDNIASVESTVVVRNHSGIDLEGTLIFPIPVDADISDFILYLDGKRLTAEVLDAAQANRIYQDIVRQMRDPGLLQYIGQGMVQAQIYPIPANGTREVKIHYTQLLQYEQDGMRLDFPLKLEGFSSSVIDSLTIKVDITVKDKLGLIYSPTHTVDINRHGEKRAVVGYEGSNIRPQGDFTLFIGRPRDRVGVSLVTHATKHNEGFFLAMIAPEYKKIKTVDVAKDFIFILDRSGSMAGQKVEQAKEALEFIFRNLNEGDRYSLITFSTEVAPFTSGWKEYSPGNEGDVINFIRSLHGDGMTFIEGAFKTAFKLKPRSEVPCYIIFLTDGLPTQGETDTAVLLQLAKSLNKDGRRIFGFGVGWDVDYHFLDLLARENGGYTTSVEPDENMEVPLAEFYSKISTPIMTDIEIDIDGVHVSDIYPRELPDLFLGGQIVLAGRYEGSGPGCISLSGRIDGQWREYEFDVYFEQSKNDFIPRLWANRKIGFLLNEVRLHGENDELVDQIINLAKRYGIITPYTSMLVVEDGEFANEGQSNAFGSLNRLAEENEGLVFSAMPKSGALAQGASKALQSQEAMENIDKGYADEIASDVRYAGDKTFYLDEDGFWVDSDYDPDEMDTEEIEYLSDEYFELTDTDADLAEYFSVGEQVIVVHEGNAYKIVDEGK